MDFDTKYQEEEFFLQVYDKHLVLHLRRLRLVGTPCDGPRYENNRMELPVRTPGAPTWPAVAKHGREVRRQQERQRKLQEKARAVKRDAQ